MAALEGGIDILKPEHLPRLDDHLFAIVHGNSLLPSIYPTLLSLKRV
jgi:hypothetical protein